MSKRIYTFILILLAGVLCIPAIFTSARIKSFKFSAHKQTSRKNKGSNDQYEVGNDSTHNSLNSDDIFTIFANTPDSIHNCSMDMIRISGYDKRPRAIKESFFITNLSPYHLLSLSLTIEYKSMSGTQMNLRRITLPCYIPSKQTRKFDISSWDPQLSFYYFRSERGKVDATPYQVSITPSRATLR